MIITQKRMITEGVINMDRDTFNTVSNAVLDAGGIAGQGAKALMATFAPAGQDLSTGLDNVPTRTI